MALTGRLAEQTSTKEDELRNGRCGGRKEGEP